MADPIDGIITVDVDDKFMQAQVSVTEPQNGGKAVTLEMVKEAIAMNAIRYNVDTEAIEKIFEEGIYDKSVIVAKGTPPVDGTNGYITYHFEQKTGADMKTDEFGNVDFRDLGMVQNIEKDTVIADIFPETPGTPGKDVRGVGIPQYPGKPVNVKVGSGIQLSDDGRQLSAAVDGNLRWDKDHFVVDKDIVIGGDVDLSVGNIDFIGDVIIKGNVNEGFVIKSAGSISVAGNVTGATLEAKGSITGKLGFVSSTIRAEGDISANFCENSDIRCSGELKANSFVGCTVFSEGKIVAGSGKAAIVGGKYTCLQDVEANYIGSDTYIKTLITLGNVAVLAEEMIDLKKKLKEYQNQLNQLEMVCTTLQQQKKAAPLTPERDEMLKRSIKAKFGHMGLIKETNERITEIESEIDNSNDLCVKVKRAAFPGVTVRINNSQLVVAQKTGACTIRTDENKDVVIR